MKKETFVFYANDSRKIQHLYLRGNFQQDMFFDKVDMINVWNRIWLSSSATGVNILSTVILNNHFHITAIFKDDEQRTSFKRHLRLSITQYHNRRYKVHGTLGTRTLKHGNVKDADDAKDCICYHIRNVLHHGISNNFIDYPYHTGRYIFGLETDKQKGIFTYNNVPEKLTAYLPVRESLPVGWLMTAEGMIVPPQEVFRSDLIEDLFESKEQYLITLTCKTTRELNDQDEPEIYANEIYANHSRKIQDEQVTEFVRGKFKAPIPAMNDKQRIEAAQAVVEAFPRVSRKLLSRIFGIPYTTLRYRLNV